MIQASQKKKKKKASNLLIVCKTSIQQVTD
jgi:hypothetical protein